MSCVCGVCVCVLVECAVRGVLVQCVESVGPAWAPLGIPVTLGNRE